MKRVHFLALAVFAGSLLILSACAPSRVSVEDYNQAQGIEPTEIPPTDISVEEPSDASEPASEDETPPPDADTSGQVPEDVPVMEGAYELQANPTGRNVVYTIDSTIEEVVLFYQEVLADYGWDIAGPADTAVGSIGTMLRENTSGDRLAINLQGNEVGGFVRLNITIHRGN